VPCAAARRVEKTRDAADAPAAKVAAAAATTRRTAPLAVLAEGGTLLYVLSGQKEMRVGEKQRLMLLVKTSTPLGLAAATLRFDPRVVAVRGVTHGSLFGEAKELLPTITPSIDPRGSLLALIAPAATRRSTAWACCCSSKSKRSRGRKRRDARSGGRPPDVRRGQNVATQLAHTRLDVKQ
jgi:hypothetical protein